MKDGQDSNLRKKARISIGDTLHTLIGNIIVGIVVLFLVGTFVLLPLSVFRNTLASKKLFKEAVALRDQGKYQESIDKYLEIPEKYSLSFGWGVDRNELLREFPKEKIFEIAAGLRERFKEDKERFVIETAIELYECLIEAYPEVAIQGEAEKIGAEVEMEIEKMGKPIEASMGKTETAKALNGKSEVTISNSADDEIEVFFSGPSLKKMKVIKDKTGTVLLTPGDYTIGVKDANPFNSVGISSNSYTATFKANRSYEHRLRFKDPKLPF